MDQHAMASASPRLLNSGCGRSGRSTPLVSHISPDLTFVRGTPPWGVGQPRVVERTICSPTANWGRPSKRQAGGCKAVSRSHESAVREQ